jgi:phosphate binding protein
MTDSVQRPKTLLLPRVIACLLAVAAGCDTTQAAQMVPAEASDLRDPDGRPPRPVQSKPPQLPASALSLMAPSIVCRALIGVDGKVIEARPAHPRADLIDYETAAVRALLDWEFEPAVRKGEKVPAWINWPVVFADAGHTANTLRLKGSDTIGGELGPRLAEAYRAKHPETTLSVTALGSATAFTGLLDGTADIGMSSRGVTTDELLRAGFLGVHLRDYTLAYDAIAIIAHPSVTVDQLTMDQLKKVFSGGVSNWKQVGGPALAVKRESRPSYSGTHSFFVEKVLGAGASLPRDTDWVERSDELVAKVAATPGAIGYIGLGWVRPGVKVLAIAGADGSPLKPTENTVLDHTYPITRPLLLFIRGAPSTDAAGFLSFATSTEGQAIVRKAGFVPFDSPTVFAPRSVPQRQTYELVRFHFAKNSAEVTAEDNARVNRLAASLRYPDVRSLLVGNADSGEEGADGLAAKRADAVLAAIHAVRPEARVVGRSDGAGHPVSTNVSDEGRAENRRVDAFVVRDEP